MPLYEYKCNGCGKINEVLQKVSAPPPTSCLYCQENSLVKQISNSSFILKGSGWYVTDFKDKKKPSPKDQGKQEQKNATDKVEAKKPTPPAPSKENTTNA